MVERFAEANAMWWNLDITEWRCRLKRYDKGADLELHQDLYPGSMRRKLAGVVQLSHPDSYGGGDLVVHTAVSLSPVHVPRTRGTLIAFPGWTVHTVERITSGTRWSLCVNGWGPRLR